MTSPPANADIAVIGAGAAGLMAAIWAGRTDSGRSIVLLDGAQKPGAKILVAGGARCNVTHFRVSAADYAGSDPESIAAVLDRLPVRETIHFFKKLGVELKREPTGKLFPVSDRSRTVLNVLINETKRRHVDFCYPCRVESVEKFGDGFSILGDWGSLSAKRVILATGGKSLPKTGSDGLGFEIAQSLGHSITPQVFPALAPLLLPEEHFIRNLSGLTLPARLSVRAGDGKQTASFTDSTLCTHFGLSGPSVLNISRYWTAARLEDARAQLLIDWLPNTSRKHLNQDLAEGGRKQLLSFLRPLLTERLASALCDEAEVSAKRPCGDLTPPQTQRLLSTLKSMPLPVTGDRGYQFAEATAGGVPLTELNLATMESKLCPGLFLCGEICDVDGRIGGFNFQWAWASGFVAGCSV